MIVDKKEYNDLLSKSKLELDRQQLDSNLCELDFCSLKLDSVESNLDYMNSKDSNSSNNSGMSDPIEVIKFLVQEKMQEQERSTVFIWLKRL